MYQVRLWSVKNARSIIAGVLVINLFSRSVAH